MTGEPDNTSLDVTDNADPSVTDNPETWDYFDPEEEDFQLQDNEENPENEGTEDEAAETETQNETEESEDAENPDEQTEPEPIMAAADAVVTLADGETATVKDLIAGNMRQDDYSRKTQELSNQRSALEAEAQKLQGITQAFVDHLSSMIPPEPDPQLSYTDPTKYTQAKAQYDAAAAQVQKLIELGSQPKEITNNLSQQQLDDIKRDQQAQLTMKFPETGTEKGKKEFYSKVGETAMELGFSREELQKNMDHRLFALAHWAHKGMAAEKAAKAAKAKAQKAAPATPRKPGQPAKQANRNAEAMRKLSRSGSINDALAVDFD